MESSPDDLYHACSGASGEGEDLAWLLHRGAQMFRSALGQAATRHGVDGVRDYIVLTSLCTEQPCIQATLGQRLGLDKTTLASLLDRFERGGWVVRRIDPDNRRARYPEITEAGRVLQRQISVERAAIEQQLLAKMAADDQRALRHALQQLLACGDEVGVQTRGSCM